MRPAAVCRSCPVKTPEGAQHTLTGVARCDPFLDTEFPSGRHFPKWFWNPSASFMALASTTARRTAHPEKDKRWTARRICLRGRASMNPGEVSSSSIHGPSIRKSIRRVTYSTGSASKQHPGSVQVQEQRDIPVANQKVGEDGQFPGTKQN